VSPNTINIFPKYTIQIPGKLSGSLAYVFNKKGLISFDYTRKDYSNTKFKPTSDSHFSNENSKINETLTAASTFRVGSEYKIEKFSLRAGYRFEESPYKNGKTIGDLSGYSLGLGYNFGNIKLDIAFDQSKQTSEQQFYSGVRFNNKTTIDNVNSNFILTLGFSL
jgi:long-subunit fatty acid transport protein